jgi:hypothetical protein
LSIGYLRKSEILDERECENGATAMAVFGIRDKRKRREQRQRQE